LEARAAGAIRIPHVTRLDQATLIVRDTGVIDTAQLTDLTEATLTADGAEPDFGALSNIHNTSVTATRGGVARLTTVAAVDNSSTTTWEADDAGSLVDLSSVTEVVLAANQRLYVNAYRGGKIDLRQVGVLSTGEVRVLADGVGSLVDLTGLSGFIGEGGSQSSLRATSSGVILLGEEAFLLANVSIEIQPGNPVLPATLARTPALTLYGRPWHSYWVETRDRRSAESPWVFFARVPMTTTLQVIAPVAPPNMAFQVREFIADLPILDIFDAPGQQVQLVLYGTPSRAYEIQSVSGADAGLPWQPGDVATMTNSFRIFAPIPAPGTQQLFRAKQR